MQKGHPIGWPFHLKIKPGSSLLSHGETPHYHRRYGVSLLSSAWGQVGPPRYRRQTNSLYILCGADTQIRTGDLTLTKGVLYQLSHISNRLCNHYWRKTLIKILTDYERPTTCCSSFGLSILQCSNPFPTGSPYSLLTTLHVTLSPRHKALI